LRCSYLQARHRAGRHMSTVHEVTYLNPAEHTASHALMSMMQEGTFRLLLMLLYQAAFETR
jgi:hypothetical protein